MGLLSYLRRALSTPYPYEPTRTPRVPVMYKRETPDGWPPRYTLVKTPPVDAWRASRPFVVALDGVEPFGPRWETEEDARAYAWDLHADAEREAAFVARVAAEKEGKAP